LAAKEAEDVLPLHGHWPLARLTTLTRENVALKNLVARQEVELEELRQKLCDTEQAGVQAIADLDRELTATCAEVDRLQKELDKRRGEPAESPEHLRLLREEACSG